MHYLPQSKVFEIIDESDCRPIEVIEDNYIGRRGNELSNTFLIRKKGISSKGLGIRLKSLLGLMPPLLITDTHLETHERLRER